MRHSEQMSPSALMAIQGDLKSVRLEGVRCPNAPTAALSLLLWWAALEGDSRVLWLWHHGGNGDGAVGAGGNADGQGMGNVGALASVPMLDPAEGLAPEKQCPHGLIVRYWQAAYDGQRNVTGRAGLMVSRTAPVNEARTGVLHPPAPARRIQQ